jgi:hypothetical protein
MSQVGCYLTLHAPLRQDLEPLSGLGANGRHFMIREEEGDFTLPFRLS